MLIHVTKRGYWRHFYKQTDIQITALIISCINSFIRDVPTQPYVKYNGGLYVYITLFYVDAIINPFVIPVLVQWNSVRKRNLGSQTW